MNIFDRFKSNKSVEPTTNEDPKSAETPNTLKTFVMQYSKAETPTFKESKTDGWVKYGESNDFPMHLLEYLETSAIHSGIVNGKSYLVAGGDFLIDEVPYTEWKKTADVRDVAQIAPILENSYGEDWWSLKEKLALDWTISGSYALKITWSLDFSRIVKVDYMPWQNIRAGIKEDGKVTKYFYAEDWKSKYGSKVEAEEYPAFDINSHLPDGELPDEYSSVYDYPYEHVQVLYVKNHFPGYYYYGRPCYIGALNAIKATGILSQFYLSSIENGFTPSMVITFNEMPGSAEEGNAVRKQIETQFTVKGIGRKLAVFFAKSKETAPTFTPLDVKNLDSQLITLQSQLYSSVITGHSVTSPELVGVSVPGQLGEGSFEEKWQLFKRTVIDRDTAAIEKTIQMISDINGSSKTIKIAERNPI